MVIREEIAKMSAQDLESYSNSPSVEKGDVNMESKVAGQSPRSIHGWKVSLFAFYREPFH